MVLRVVTCIPDAGSIMKIFAGIPGFAAAFSLLMGVACDPIDTLAAGSETPLTVKTRTIADFTKDLTKIGGFLTLYRDDADGSLFLEIPASGGPDLLYLPILTSGLGSRDLADNLDALDRGKFGPSRLVAFRRYGKRVLVIERNTNYLTPSSPLGSSQDAGLSFANSTVGSLDVKAEEGGVLIVDATKFFGRDGIGVPSILKSSDQGSYKIEPSLSAVDAAHAHTTEHSIEVDALLTFSNSEPPPSRNIVGRVSANRTSIVVHERNALIQLPDLTVSSYRPRVFDPRSGYFDNTFFDPSLLPDKSPRQSFILRYALAKKTPDEEISEPEKPIVFYIDPGVPRSLHPLIAEAASWWNSAFERAGFRNAIQTRDLPDGTDPFALGINIILWVPRETRGYSVGGVVSDPRTGEILKAIIRLDAMRMPADRLLLDALTSPYTDQPYLATRDEVLRRRFRLLVAHEIGHTLGLRHQFIASAQGMSSVMDYPFPYIPLDASGVPTLHEDAFPTGVGAWDKAAIFYGYHPFRAEAEEAGLHASIEAAEREGLYWMTDQDAAGANPLVEKWDRGTDPIGELEEVLALRRAALTRFSVYVIPPDEPLSALQDALVPLYLLHQFEVKAVAAMLGGYTYRYALRDEQRPQPVPMTKQRQALQAFLRTLNTETLWPDAHILALMAPRPPSYTTSDESFSGATGRIFDVLRPVEEAASITMGEILQPDRAARLAEAKAIDPDALSLDEVLAAVINHTWKSPAQQGFAGSAQRAIAMTVLRSLLTSAGSKSAPMAVRGAYLAALDDLVNWNRTHPPTQEWQDAYAFATHAIAAVERETPTFEIVPRRALLLDPLGEFDAH